MHLQARPLIVAILGNEAPAFAQALESSLRGLLPAPSRDLLYLFEAKDAPHAELRCLLAWENEDSGHDAIAALQAQQQLRRDLHAQGLNYVVLRGPLRQRLAQGLGSLLPWLPELGPLLPQTGVQSRRPGWTCSDCSDPDCEHRSFTALLAERQPRPEITCPTTE